MDIIPSYYCNFDCDFCRTHTGSYQEPLDLRWLEEQLKHIPVKHINILGGEPFLLPKHYLQKLIEICYNKTGKKPGLYTNLTHLSDSIEDVELTVSYDPYNRQDLYTVLTNMLELRHPFRVNTLLTSYMVEKGVKRQLFFLREMRLCYQLVLSTLNVPKESEDFKADLRPNPLALAAFCEELAQTEEERLYFYPLWVLKHRKTKETDFADVVEILPTKEFRVSFRDDDRPATFFSYKIAEKYYYASKDYPAIERCETCPYYGFCTNMYQPNRDGSCADYMIMERMEAALKA